MINIKLHLKKRTMIFLIVTFMITICTIGDVSASHAWTINDIDRVKAIEIPTLPTTGVLGDANKYVIVYNNVNGYDNIAVYFFESSAYIKANCTLDTIKNEFSTYGYFDLFNVSSVYGGKAYSYYFNKTTQKWTNLGTTSSGNNFDSGVILYSTVSIKNKTTGDVMIDNFDINVGFKEIKIVSTNQSDYNYININFSDYIDDKYHYWYSTDNKHYIELDNDELTNYSYIFKQYYNTTVSASVTDEKGNVIANNILTISDLIEGYYAWVHVNDNDIKDYGIWLSQSDHTSKIIDDKIYNISKYPIAFYTSPSFTDDSILEISDNACLAKNVDVYIKYIDLPPYTYKLYYEDSDLYIQFEFTNLINNGMYIQYSSSIEKANFTFNYANIRPKFKVTIDDVITIKYFIIPVDVPRTLREETFTITDIINSSENANIKNEYDLEHKYDNSDDVVNNSKSIIDMFKDFFTLVKDIMFYFWNKCNIWIKSTIIILIIEKLIKGIYSLLVKRGVL